MKSILFNTEMAKAILDDKKTQTRRVINVTLYGDEKLSIINDDNKQYLKVEYENGAYRLEKIQFQIGDILWVREPVKLLKHTVDCDGEYFGTWIKYLADGKEILFDNFKEDVSGKKWFDKCQGVPNGCLREMARIFLKVTSVRVERLQDITEDDICKEGLDNDYLTWWVSECGTARALRFPIDGWKRLWKSTAKDGYKWEDNPHVFVYEFERVEKGSAI